MLDYNEMYVGKMPVELNCDAVLLRGKYMRSFFLYFLL